MGRAKTEGKDSAKRRFSGFWDTIRTLIYAVLAALIVRTVAIEPFNIPSGSMIPTLLVGDYLFVSKYAYGYSTHSLPWSIDVFDGRIIDSPPDRGRRSCLQAAPRQFDRLHQAHRGAPRRPHPGAQGRAAHQRDAVKRERVDDYSYTDRYGRERVLRQYRETLPNGVSYMTSDATPTGGLDNTQIYTVPPDHYFAMGDNRDNSLDSRVPSVGFIPSENLVGRAEFIFHSLEDGTSIGEVWNWPSATRSERVFKAID